LLLGVSRKSFLGQLLGVDVGDRLPGALACAAWAVNAGVQVLRTHDVASTRQAARVTDTLRQRAATHR
jgi:dihydropteroate synthase